MSVLTRSYAFAALGLAVGVGLMAGPSGSPAVLGFAGVLGAAGFGGLFWTGKERRRSDRLAADVARLEALLAASPHPWCAWNAEGAVSAAPGCAGFLGTEPGQDIASAFADSDAPRVAEAVRRLRGGGEDFRIEATTRSGRRLLLNGRRAAGHQNAGHQNVIWLEDITDRCAEQEGLTRGRHDAESALAELRAAVDALPLPVWLRGAGQTLSWCNRAYARAVDSDPAAVPDSGKELSDAGRALAQRALRSGVAQSERVSAVIGAERRLLEVTEAPLPAPDGGGTLVVGYALDVTAVEELRGELSRHLAAHGEVLERLGAAIAIFGADTRLTFFNQAYARLWDLEESWLRSQPTHGEILEELRTRRRLPEYADYQSYKRERLSRYTRLLEPVEELMHLPDGTTLRSLAAPHPLGGLMQILEDVTNTLALESSYNTLIAVQQETLDNLAEGIAVFGGDGRLKLSNPAFARVWDLDDEDLLGEPHISGLFERMRPFLENGGDWDSLKDEMIGATLERAVRSGRLERADGSVVEFSTLPLPDGAVLNSYLDVTDSARLEQALRASNAALEAADQLKSEFIANVSHHLRNPLNGIIGFAEVLANQYFGELNPRQIEYVKGVLNAGERLLELIDDVVDMTSLGAGVTTLDRAVVDVPDLLETVGELTREWARREGLRLDLAAPSSLGEAEGDARRLKQALFTLVVGAIRHPPADRRILLSGERTAGTIVLTVGSGAGPGEAALPSRYDRNDPRGAAALGLSLVRNVMELHGGRLEVEEWPGHGTRFRCVLPLPPASGPKPS
ncbi:sensor histidine kinase [Azospirillum brasilense]|uniref:sensor histidine kinase n=1 Tax=Azospirillum brasilense TaxID=192 RepID=UPI000E67B662|nr:PAS domain-containing sensor histidine kinase [Azospirillum brasilense]NUB28040.1 PAS domain-containing protein [Azospirillum brasilense]NUB34289.1 PAS domain-containing protein [Azospirillum brasilense]RIV99067.1 PAS domain-containing protein [Azospirillum brasilense]